MNALLIIDMLRDFVMPDGALYVNGAQKITEPIFGVVSRCRTMGMKIVYANDWHPISSLEFKIWPPHCIRYTVGSDIVPGLEPRVGDVILHKDDLSVFTNPFSEAVFSGIENVYVVGVATEYCVKSAVIGTADRNGKPITNLSNLCKNVIILSDCIMAANINPDDGEKAIREMSAFRDNVIFQTSTELNV